MKNVCLCLATSHFACKRRHCSIADLIGRVHVLTGSSMFFCNSLKSRSICSRTGRRGQNILLWYIDLYLDGRITKIYLFSLKYFSGDEIKNIFSAAAEIYKQLENVGG